MKEGCGQAIQAASFDRDAENCLCAHSKTSTSLTNGLHRSASESELFKSKCDFAVVGVNNQGQIVHYVPGVDRSILAVRRTQSPNSKELIAAALWSRYCVLKYLFSYITCGTLPHRSGIQLPLRLKRVAGPGDRAKA